jgi:hypothetical protein
MQEEQNNAVSWQQGGLVENSMVTEREEQQQQQAGFTTLVGNQRDGEMVSVGSGKVTLQCGDCDYNTQ